MGSGFSHLGVHVCSEEEVAEIIALGSDLASGSGSERYGVDLRYSGEPGTHILTLRYGTTKHMVEVAIPG